MDEDLDYEKWLEVTELEDTAENKGWFECPEEDRYNYIKEHQEWWNKF